jgi:hypothetical protein
MSALINDHFAASAGGVQISCASHRSAHPRCISAGKGFAATLWLAQNGASSGNED